MPDMHLSLNWHKYISSWTSQSNRRCLFLRGRTVRNVKRIWNISGTDPASEQFSWLFGERQLNIFGP